MNPPGRSAARVAHEPRGLAGAACWRAAAARAAAAAASMAAAAAGGGGGVGGPGRGRRAAEEASTARLGTEVLAHLEGERVREHSKDSCSEERGGPLQLLLRVVGGLDWVGVHMRPQAGEKKIRKINLNLAFSVMFSWREHILFFGHFFFIFHFFLEKNN